MDNKKIIKMFAEIEKATKPVIEKHASGATTETRPMVFSHIKVDKKKRFRGVEFGVGYMTTSRIDDLTK